MLDSQTSTFLYSFSAVPVLCHSTMIGKTAVAQLHFLKSITIKGNLKHAIGHMSLDIKMAKFLQKNQA